MISGCTIHPPARGTRLARIASAPRASPSPIPRARRSSSAAWLPRKRHALGAREHVRPLAAASRDHGTRDPRTFPRCGPRCAREIWSRRGTPSPLPLRDGGARRLTIAANRCYIRVDVWPLSITTRRGRRPCDPRPAPGRPGMWQCRPRWRNHDVPRDGDVARAPPADHRPTLAPAGDLSRTDRLTRRPACPCLGYVLPAGDSTSRK
jgi:hypothetical protein